MWTSLQVSVDKPHCNGAGNVASQGLEYGFIFVATLWQMQTVS